MTTIAASDSKILYSPYTWGVAGGAACTIDAGAYFTIAFTGTPTTAPTLGFDVSALAAPFPRIAVQVDGGAPVVQDVAASVPAPIPAGPTWGKHVIRVTVVATSETLPRWGGTSTQVRFTGLTADATITSATVRARAGRLLLIGDSILEGVRTLNMTATRDTDRNDSRLSWGLPLADALGMEAGCVGFGAVGISKSGSGGVPRFADNIPYLWSGVARDLSAGPTAVVCHIGTNDNSSTDAEVTADTKRLLDYLIANTACPIIVMPGWLQRKASAIQAGIAASTAPTRATFVDTTGWWSTADAADSLHPYGYVNVIDLVPRLAARIDQVLGAFVPPVVPPAPAPAFFINRGGAAYPVY